MYFYSRIAMVTIEKSYFWMDIKEKKVKKTISISYMQGKMYHYNDLLLSEITCFGRKKWKEYKITRRNFPTVLCSDYKH